MTSALAGIRVVDLTANMAGPYATLILAEQGAEVIKVEPPGGDVIRKMGSGRGGISAYFANLNRGKRSVCVDLAGERGRTVINRLAQRSDVVVQAFRPGVADKLGIGAQQLRALNSQLVYASISGYGTVGPLAHESAYDQVVQALSGMASLQRSGPQDAAQLIRHGVVDKSTGMAIAQAVTAALLRRCREGTGSEIAVSMLDTALHFLWPDGMMNHACLDPIDLRPPVSRSFRLTPTLDGQVSIVTVTDKQWTALVKAVGWDHLLDDPDLQGPEARLQHAGRVMREIAQTLATMTTADVIAKLRAHGVPCMPVVALDEVSDHEQVVAAQTLVESYHPVLGRMRHPRPPVRVAGESPDPLCPAPALGDQTDAVLQECGWSPSEIARLHADGIVA